MQRMRISDLRKRLELSQERFAQRLGVSLQTVRRWESGLTRPLPIITMRLRELELQTEAQPHKEEPAMREQKTIKGEGITLDVGLGLGGLFKGMGSLIDVLAKMTEEGKEETNRTGTLEAMDGKLKGVYGFSVRLGLGGKPVVEQFGNIRETPSGAEVSETREPLVDVLDEGDQILVIAEMPGVEAGDVDIEVEGDILKIAASKGVRQYRKEVLLPTTASPKNVATSYRNGILEVKLTKVQPGQE